MDWSKPGARSRSNIVIQENFGLVDPEVLRLEEKKRRGFTLANRIRTSFGLRNPSRKALLNSRGSVVELDGQCDYCCHPRCILWYQYSNVLFRPLSRVTVDALLRRLFELFHIDLFVGTAQARRCHGRVCTIRAAAEPLQCFEFCFREVPLMLRSERYWCRDSRGEELQLLASQ